MPVDSDPRFADKVVAIQELSQSFGLEVDLPCSGLNGDVRRILRLIEEGFEFIVDLSFERPSCYYELGQIEAGEIRPRLIAVSGTPIHQSMSRDRIVEYSSFREFVRMIEGIFADAKEANEQQPKG